MFKFSESERIVENKKIMELNKNLKKNQNIKREIKMKDNSYNGKIIKDESNIKKCSLCIIN